MYATNCNVFELEHVPQVVKINTTSCENQSVSFKNLSCVLEDIFVTRNFANGGLSISEHQGKFKFSHLK